MAAVVVAAQAPQSRFNIARKGDVKERIGLITVTSSADTLDLTGSPVINQVSWEPVNTSDDIAVTHSAGTITFTGTAGSTGFLHVSRQG